MASVSNEDCHGKDMKGKEVEEDCHGNDMKGEKEVEEGGLARGLLDAVTKVNSSSEGASVVPAIVVPIEEGGLASVVPAVLLDLKDCHSNNMKGKEEEKEVEEGGVALIVPAVVVVPRLELEDCHGNDMKGKEGEKEVEEGGLALVVPSVVVDNDNSIGQCASINLPQPTDDSPPDVVLSHERKMPYQPTTQQSTICLEAAGMWNVGHVQ